MDFARHMGVPKGIGLESQGDVVIDVGQSQVIFQRRSLGGPISEVFSYVPGSILWDPAHL